MKTSSTTFGLIETATKSGAEMSGDVRMEPIDSDERDMMNYGCWSVLGVE